MRSLSEKIEAALDRAEYVRYFDEVLYVWDGGHTVNIYLVPEFQPIDCFSVGSFTKNAADIEEVIEGIEEAIQERKSGSDF